MKINKGIIFMLLLLSIVMIGAVSAACDDGASAISDISDADSIIETDDCAIGSDAILENEDNQLSDKKAEAKMKKEIIITDYGDGTITEWRNETVDNSTTTIYATLKLKDQSGNLITANVTVGPVSSSNESSTPKDGSMDDLINEAVDELMRHAQMRTNAKTFIINSKNTTDPVALKVWNDVKYENKMEGGGSAILIGDDDYGKPINNTVKFITRLWGNYGKEWAQNLTVNAIALNSGIQVVRAPTVIEYNNMTTYAVSAFDGRVGEKFNVTLKDANGKKLANKIVQIGFNGKVYTKITDKDGKTDLQINLGYKGDYTFAICFLGDDMYQGSFEVAKIVVKEQTPKIITKDISYKSSAKNKEISVTFKTSTGKPIVGKSIKVTINGKTLSAKTDENGVATVKVSLSAKKTYAFTVKWAGDSTFLTATAKGKLTIN